MAIPVDCQECESQFKVPDAAAGKRVKCPRCECLVRVPAVPVPDDGREEFEEKPPARKVTRRNEAEVSDEEPHTKLSEQLLEQVFAELTQGERLVWACQPSPRVMYLRGVGMLVGGCFFAGLGILLAGVLSRQGGISLVPVLLTTLFPGVGLLVGICGVLFSKKQAANTIYALTNRRAIVWKAQYFGPAKVEHYDAGQVRGLKRQDNYFIKGAGDIIFRQEKTVTVTVSKRRVSTSESVKNFGFLHVEAAREVEKLIRETLHIRFRDDDVLPEPNPEAVVKAQAAVAGKPIGSIATAGFAAAALLFFVPAGIGAAFLMNAPAAKQGAPAGGAPGAKKAEPGSPEDWANILADLNGADGFKRSAAAERLSKMTPDAEHRKDVVAALARKLSEGPGQDDCGRALAVWAGPDDSQVLVDALKHPSGNVRASAISALSRLRIPVTAEPLAGLLVTGQEREKVKAALIAIGPAAEPAVLPLLNEPNKDTRIDALRVLAKIGTAASLSAIDKIAESKAKDRNLSKEAEDAAKEIRKRK